MHRPGRRSTSYRAAVVYDGCYSGEQGLVVDLADGEAVVRVVDQGQVGPAARDGCARPCARIASMATSATSVEACIGMLPKPTYIGRC